MPRKRKDPAAVSLGRRGGKAKVPKGLATMSPEKREEIRAKALETRRAQARGHKCEGFDLAPLEPEWTADKNADSRSMVNRPTAAPPYRNLDTGDTEE